MRPKPVGFVKEDILCSIGFCIILSTTEWGAFTQLEVVIDHSIVFQIEIVCKYEKIQHNQYQIKAVAPYEYHR